jgi:hypothetical protein
MSDAPEAALVCITMTSLMTATPLVLRSSGSLTVTAHVFIASTVALYGGVGALLGGLIAPTTAILAVAPILAVFLIGRAAGVFWSAVVLVWIAAFFALPRLGVAMPLYIDADRLPDLRAAGLATLVTVSLFFVLQYDAAKNTALHAVREANSRMRAMIAHLDATSDALSQSAAEFLGADDAYAVFAARSTRERGDDADDRGGLTHQMQRTAASSRLLLGNVGASLRGMIEQYNTISARIYDLAKQSGTIEELVYTIDSISDRLDLMALNTGIEAAHAGQSGAQFQLLADDMRRLAERVIAETDRIKASIETVQRHTQAALEASLAGQALTDEGTAQLEAMGRAFDRLHRLIERTAQASQRITGDTISQLATIHALVSTSLEQPEIGD